MKKVLLYNVLSGFAFHTMSSVAAAKGIAITKWLY